MPVHAPANSEDVEKIKKFLSDKPRILVLTGAGISTESGDSHLSRDNIN